MNPEKMSKDQNKKEFARFVEDYNTGAPTCSFVSIIPIFTLVRKHYSHISQRKVLQYRGLRKTHECDASG